MLRGASRGKSVQLCVGAGSNQREKQTSSSKCTWEYWSRNKEAVLSALRRIPQNMRNTAGLFEFGPCSVQAASTEVKDPRGASLGTEALLLFQPAGREFSHSSLSEAAKWG